MEDEIEQAIERMKKMSPLISKIKRIHRGITWQGIKICPICDGKLHIRHSGYNGHVWGKCETENCVCWAE